MKEGTVPAPPPSTSTLKRRGRITYSGGIAFLGEPNTRVRSSFF